MKYKQTVFLLPVVIALCLLLGASAASGAPPEPATLKSPSGTITDNTPTYTWNAVADSPWYCLFVWDSTKTEEIIYQWYTAEEAGCSDGTGECSVTPETVLADDLHKWWIRTWNEEDSGDWSAGMSFTVEGATSLAPVPRTGQTRPYSAGDDGDLQKGVPWPDPRFTDNEDGTVTDNLTGLIWLKDAYCSDLEVREGEGAGWDAAVDLSNNLADGQCGLSDGSVSGDWHLPNVREFQSLVDYGNQPALPTGHPFDNVQITWAYWTSTTQELEQTDWFAWTASFLYGEMAAFRPKNTMYNVWPVRGGN